MSSARTLAFTGRLSGVNLHMSSDVGVPRERFRAPFAGVPFLSGVALHMSCHAGLAWEAFPTLFTQVRLLSGVHSHVLREVALD